MLVAVVASLRSSPTHLIVDVGIACPRSYLLLCKRRLVLARDRCAPLRLHAMSVAQGQTSLLQCWGSQPTITVSTIGRLDRHGNPAQSEVVFYDPATGFNRVYHRRVLASWRSWMWFARVIRQSLSIHSSVALTLLHKRFPHDVVQLIAAYVDRCKGPADGPPLPKRPRGRRRRGLHYSLFYYFPSVQLVQLPTIIDVESDSDV